MSDGRQILKEGLGTPLAWVFNSYNKVIQTKDGNPLNSFITQFRYTYDEEGDDICEINFEFQNVGQLDLPYLRQDVILIVQWGYILPNGRPLKSPKRKVAIRDIDTTYSAAKISIKLKCTDLVAYLAGFKTTTTKKFTDPDAATKIAAVKDAGDHFVDYLKEEMSGEYQAVITEGKNAVRIDRQGGVRGAHYNIETGEYTIARDRTAIPKVSVVEYHAAKVYNGKGQAISNAIKDKLRALDSLSGIGGPYIADATDDTLHMKQRNFRQRPFKNFTYGGGFGEFLNFTPHTNTRKVKEKIVATSTVDPEEKEVVATEVAAIDNAETISVWPNQDYSVDPIEITPEAIKAELKRYRENYEHNVRYPLTQKHLPDLEFYETPPELIEGEDGISPKDKMGFYQRAEYGVSSGVNFRKVKIPAKDILLLPYTQSIIDDFVKEEVDQYINTHDLVGYMVEKIQRKYEGTLEVIGDPSLIKGKTYGIYNLSPLDEGIWYATTVTHNISRNKGYICTLELIKKPATITIDRHAVRAKMREIDGKIEPENKFNAETTEIYKPDPINAPTGKEDMDELQITSTEPEQRQRQQIGEIEDRIEAIESEEEFTMGSIATEAAFQSELSNPKETTIGPKTEEEYTLSKWRRGKAKDL